MERLLQKRIVFWIRRDLVLMLTARLMSFARQGHEVVQVVAVLITWARMAPSILPLAGAVDQLDALSHVVMDCGPVGVHGQFPGVCLSSSLSHRCRADSDWADVVKCYEKAKAGVVKYCETADDARYCEKVTLVSRGRSGSANSC